MKLKSILKVKVQKILTFLIISKYNDEENFFLEIGAYHLKYQNVFSKEF
jgi:hypothetical protein